MKNSSDLNRNRTRYLPACIAVPQPTAPPRARDRLLVFIPNGGENGGCVLKENISKNIRLCSPVQWPRGLRRRSSAARLLRLWVLIPPGAWMFVCCECCVLSGRGLCDGLITRPEEPYRLWRVVVCDQETSNTRRLKPATGLWKYNHNG
jgi:hypothetical protein